MTETAAFRVRLRACRQPSGGPRRSSEHTWAIALEGGIDGTKNSLAG